ncbi:MAG: patatin-like phospholipase family protein [Patescibacteria group bacterium]|nr:patatin-like phospholipase family protein [Patescibacteria group bacterium]
MEKKRKKIGLALGSGALKGLAHIGVIKVLEENNIPIDFIAGTSIGALVGAIYAYFGNSRILENIVAEADLKSSLGLLDPTLKKGFLRGEKIMHFFKKHVKARDFKELKKPLVILATDLRNGEAEVIKSGDLVSAVRASISVPIIFQPVKREGKMLIDGGMTMPVPVKPLKQIGADIVIAVNLYNYAKRQQKRFRKINLSFVGNKAAEIMLYQLAKRDVEEADVVIEPDVEGFSLIEAIKKREKIMKLGEEAALAKIREIKKLLN